MHASKLPPLDGYESARALALEMHARRQIARVPAANDDAFRVVESPRWAVIRRAHAAIANMFWGPRIESDSAFESIRSWIAAAIE